MVAKMADRPIIFALANPMPEIMPDVAREVAPDAIIATGRSDFPNQVNNVLCFPFIFRGALDVGATEINDAMQIACVEGIAELARTTTSAEAAKIYQGEQLTFGADYLIPKPFDPRLSGVVSTAVAGAAMESGVAARPLADLEAYKADLDASVYKSALLMRPVFEAAAPPRAGSSSRRARTSACCAPPRRSSRRRPSSRSSSAARRSSTTLRADGSGNPPGSGFQPRQPENDPRYRDYWDHLSRIMKRGAASPRIWPRRSCAPTRPRSAR